LCDQPRQRLRQFHRGGCGLDWPRTDAGNNADGNPTPHRDPDTGIETDGYADISTERHHHRLSYSGPIAHPDQRRDSLTDSLSGQ
jgi:hypothetical protein